MKVRIVVGRARTEVAVDGVQGGARERPDRPGGAEQPRMPGDAAERPGVLVVHFADQRAAAPWVVLGRGVRSRQSRGGLNVSGSSVT